MKPTLGQCVYVDKVYEWPSKDKWEDGATVEFAPIDNPLNDKVAVVVGESRKQYRGELSSYCNYTLDGVNEGIYVDMHPSKRAFIAIRYTLDGRRYYTTPEYLREA